MDSAIFCSDEKNMNCQVVLTVALGRSVIPSTGELRLHTCTGDACTLARLHTGTPARLHRAECASAVSRLVAFCNAANALSASIVDILNHEKPVFTGHCQGEKVINKKGLH